MHNYRLWSAFSKLLLILLLNSSQASAVVNVDRTRVVFNAGEMTQSVMLINTGAQPAAVQVWTDKGDATATPDGVTTPLVALPPVFRLQPGERRSLRLLLSSRATLTADRENLFWLNIYQVPPNTRQPGKTLHQVILPLRIRMKVLVRPAGLRAPGEETGQQLRFAVKDKMLQITNPEAWYQSLNLTITGQAPYNGLMVAPYSTLPLPLAEKPQQGATIEWETFDDIGNRHAWTHRLP